MDLEQLNKKLIEVRQNKSKALNVLQQLTGQETLLVDMIVTMQDAAKEGKPDKANENNE
jgi:hypothetical protein